LSLLDGAIPSDDGVPHIESESVRAVAAAAVLSNSEAKGNEALGRLLPFLLIPEPVVEELPVYFLPPGAERVVDEQKLREIAVAGRLVYAQVRWLDDLADSNGPSDPPGSVHRLAEALASEAGRRFTASLADSRDRADFFSSLVHLHACYAASLTVDGAWGQSSPVPLGLEDYVEHAKARAAPLRAPLDALLLLVGASETEAKRARSCFELCAAALQLHDDALDVEEDFEAGRLSWVVSETLHSLGDLDKTPDADEFYEAALLGGFLERNLAGAEALFRRALALAEGRLPRCVEFLKKEARSTCAMKDDIAELVAASRRKKG